MSFSKAKWNTPEYSYSWTIELAKSVTDTIMYERVCKFFILSMGNSRESRVSPIVILMRNTLYGQISFALLGKFFWIIASTTSENREHVCISICKSKFYGSICTYISIYIKHAKYKPLNCVAYGNIFKYSWLLSFGYVKCRFFFFL